MHLGRLIPSRPCPSVSPYATSISQVSSPIFGNVSGQFAQSVRRWPGHAKLSCIRLLKKLRLKTRALQVIEFLYARMVELVDTRDLKSRGPGRVRAGSSPAPGTSGGSTSDAVRTSNFSLIAIFQLMVADEFFIARGLVVNRSMEPL